MPKSPLNGKTTKNSLDIGAQR